MTTSTPSLRTFETEGSFFRRPIVHALTYDRAERTWSFLCSDYGGIYQAGWFTPVGAYRIVTCSKCNEILDE